ncbi:MAG: precorrin-2 C(20)-methyltransferase [Thermaerobacter sp.]|nr:precorrin-2 C(20)-methyltransferase [Thermaerobacter sp.]
MSPGRLYGVGVGPGNPEWLTLRAVAVLQAVDVVAHPGKHDGYALRIVAPLIDSVRQEILPLNFPMEGDPLTWESAWQRGAETICDRLRRGAEVAFITEGDPLLYSTFGYVLGKVRTVCPRAGIEVVPGISAVSGSAARLQLPLVSGRQSLAVVPAGDPSVMRSALANHDTVVFLKVGAALETLIAVLEEAGCLQRAVAISHASSGHELITHDLRTWQAAVGSPAPPIPYMTLVVVACGQEGDPK